MNSLRIASALALLCLAAGCTNPPQTAGVGDPDNTADQPSAVLTKFAGEPSIRGTITAIAGTAIRVEEVPEDEAGSAKATVRLTSGTAIRHVDGSTSTTADLKVGDTVSVWFTGPVAESYPVQAVAGAIEVEAPKDPR